MRNLHFLKGLWLTGVVSTVIAQPVWAQVAQITSVELISSDSGLEVLLETTGVTATLVRSYQRGQQLIAEISNAQLRLPEGQTFRQENPTDQITSVTVAPQDTNRVQVVVTGKTETPTGQVFLREGQGLVVNVKTPATAEQPTPAPQVEELEPINLIVTATRTEEEREDIPRSVTVIERKQIEEQANLSRGLQDILGQLVPGLGTSPQRNFLTGQNLRGRRPLVLIDGVPQSTNFDAPQQELRTIDPAAIERIEVVRGPTSTYGADAAGGVINIITRRPEEAQFNLTTEAGISNALTGSEDDFGNWFQGTLSVNEQEGDFTLSLAREDTGNFFDAEGDLIPFTEGQDNSETFDVLGKLGINIDEQQRLQLTVNYFREDREPDFISDPAVLDIPGIQKARALEIDPEFIGYSLEPQENTIVNLEYTNDDLLGSQVTGQAFFRNYNDGQDIPTELTVLPGFIFSANAKSQQWGGRLNIDTPLGRTSNLVWGFDYVNENSSQEFNVFDPETFGESGGRVFRLTETGTNTPPYDYESFGIFAQAQWDITDRLLVSGGIRHERAGFSVDDYTGPFLELLASPPIDFLPTANIEGGERDFSDTTFNIGVVYDASENISLFANFAQGFSVPDIGRILRLPIGFTSVEEDFPALEPQKIDNYELGVLGNWNSLQFSLAGFFNRSELGSSIAVNDVGLLEIVRAPERIYGVEATLDWQPSSDWQLGSTLTWQEGEFDPDDDDDFQALSSLRISPLKLTSYVENKTLPGWRNRLQLVFLGDRNRAFDDGVDRAAIESFITVDYISGIRLGPGELQIGIENLFNEQYFPVFSQIQAGEGNETENFAARGRTLRVGYRVAW